ncbi:MAG: glycosyltransferase family 2 protein [Planctomycetota bacterium]
MTDPRPRFMSVVLTTYNSPDWLQKVLWGYAIQTRTDFEIVIADDGSTSETKSLIERARDETGLNIRHVWHEDDGFRKCEILNRATSVTGGDYLIFSDGDCIPRADFLQQHHQHAERGRFLSGGYIKLPMSLSQAIERHDIERGDAFRLSWLRARGLPLSARWLRLIAGPRLAQCLNAVTTTRPTWNGNNASGWKSDIVAAGGFDERMRYGGLDRELGERLENAGIRGKHIRFQTVVIHLDHPRGYANEADLRRNLAIRHETRTTGRKTTAFGLNAA